MTVVYLLVSAAMVAGLATVVAQSDAHEREVRLDATMQVQASTAAALVHVKGSRLVLDDLVEHDVASGQGKVVVLSGTPPARQEFAGGRLPAVVGRSQLQSVAAEAARTGRVSRNTTVVASGDRMKLVAAPFVDEAGNPAGAVVVVGDAATVAGGRTRLLLALALGCVGVLLLMATGSHLLAGRTIRSMRLVLEQHTRFVAEATRDLRRPIAHLRDLAVDAVGDRRRREDLPSHAVRLCARADDVIDDVLVGAKLDAGTFPLLRRPVRLDWLVETVAATTATMVGADEEVDVATRPCTVVADAFLVRHAVGHLVENALHHGRPGSADAPGGVEVRVFGDGRVTVADRGPGVDRSVASALHNGLDAPPSTFGRGLAVCRWTALLHGGALAVAQRPGGGAVWTLRLQPEATGLGPATPEEQGVSVSPGTWE